MRCCFRSPELGLPRTTHVESGDIMKKWIALTAFVTAVPAAPANLVAQDTIQLELAVASGVEESMPVGEAQEFSADVGRVFLWTRVHGAADSSIQHVWIHGEMEFPVSLQIGGSPWRTWSSKTIPPEWAGEWSVEVRDEAGNVLESRTFMVGM